MRLNKRNIHYFINDEEDTMRVMRWIPTEGIWIVIKCYSTALPCYVTSSIKFWDDVDTDKLISSWRTDCKLSVSQVPKPLLDSLLMSIETWRRVFSSNLGIRHALDKMYKTADKYADWDPDWEPCFDDYDPDDPMDLRNIDYD